MWPGVPSVDHVTLDYEGDIPLYRQLADLLRGQIKSGAIPPRRPIPSKRYLTETYGVSAGTVERALDVLKADGMLKTVMGRGLYVTDRSEWKAGG
jgi:DNA-binding GntR family transcriptional regulator